LVSSPALFTGEGNGKAKKRVGQREIMTRGPRKTFLKREDGL